jgi:hypothetical protein
MKHILTLLTALLLAPLAVMYSFDYPTPDDRDTKRIVGVAQSAGIKQFDYIVATLCANPHAMRQPSTQPAECLPSR